jgi:tetratricopeptide (TPR) repeat protein
MRKRSLLPAVTILLLPTIVLPQVNVLRGKVRATSGVTVNNAIVELRQPGGAMIAQTVTRNDGDFSFSGLGTGEYEVVVTIAGYEPISQFARFMQSDRMNFQEVINIEVVIRPRAEQPLAPPGTSFVQDVPKAARAAYLKAIAKLREGKSEEAIAFLREAIGVYNEYFDAYFALGTEFVRLGKDSEALEALERARQVNDREGAVYYTFGLVMIKQQKFGVAEYAFGKAAQLSAGSPAAHFNHALALIEVAVRVGDTGKAKTYFADANKELDRAWELSAKRLTPVFLQRARIHEKLGDREAAARDLEAYLKAEPDAKNGIALKEAIETLRRGKK